MSHPRPTRLVRFGSAKALTRASTFGAHLEAMDPTERWME